MKISNETKVFVSTLQSQNNKIKQSDKTEKLSRVEQIKRDIEAGNYKIDIPKTAKAMAKALLS